MNPNLVLLISSSLMTAILIFGQIKRNIPHANRRIIVIGILAMLVVDSYALYRVLNSPSVEASDQPTALTRACQDMQKPLLVEKGVAESDLDRVTLPVCTCIVSEIKQNYTYNELEKLAAQGKSFLELVGTHRELLLSAMNKCGEN